MGCRRNTNNRLTLFRTCYVCGKTFSTTADTPFIRQIPNVDGKKQKTCYFCSEACKASTYKHLFDGKAQERKRERDRKRDRREWWKQYYAQNADHLRERTRQRWQSMSPAERSEEGRFYRKKRTLQKVMENAD